MIENEKIEFKKSTSELKEAINDILTRNISRRRNEVIADILNRAHYVERKGRGISLIKEKEPNTQFDEIGNLFIATFIRRDTRVEAKEKLGKHQKTIVAYININPKITIAELSKTIKVSTTTIEKTSAN